MAKPFPSLQDSVEIRPRSLKQAELLKSIQENDITFAVGPAGTGRTYVCSLAAARAFINEEVNRIVIIRPAVGAGGEDIGHLPGTKEEKLWPYVLPILDSWQDVWTPEKIKWFISENLIEIVPVAYLRGRTFSNAYIIVDEAQNMSYEQLLLAVTRLGEGSKLLIDLDYAQCDLPARVRKGEELVRTLRSKGLEQVGFVEFTASDVVRHPTVKALLKSLS